MLLTGYIVSTQTKCCCGRVCCRVILRYRAITFVVSNCCGENQSLPCNSTTESREAECVDLKFIVVTQPQ